MAELVAYHGWGFDSSCWDSLKERMADQIDFRTFERGYYSKREQNVQFKNDAGTKIILAHSFGLHLCPPEQWEVADIVIIFNGFIHFHPEAAQFKRRSRLILQQMIKKFREDPKSVLHKFIRNAYKPSGISGLNLKELNEQKLLNDLKHLNETELDVKILNKPDKICILHGSDDEIVPRLKGREIYDRTHKHSTYFEIKNAGHALPFTHTDESWSFIRPELSNAIDI